MPRTSSLDPGNLLSRAQREVRFVGFDQAQAEVDEGAGSVTLNLVRQCGSTGIVSVEVSTVAGTAVPGTNYNAIDQTVTLWEMPPLGRSDVDHGLVLSACATSQPWR